MVGIVTRLTAQKGIHLIKHCAGHTKFRGAQFVLLGAPVPLQPPPPEHLNGPRLHQEMSRLEFNARMNHPIKFWDQGIPPPPPRLVAFRLHSKRVVASARVGKHRRRLLCGGFSKSCEWSAANCVTRDPRSGGAGARVLSPRDTARTLIGVRAFPACKAYRASNDCDMNTKGVLQPGC